MKILRSCLPVALILPFGTTLAETPASAGALAALKALDMRYFVAGGTCAAFSHGITCPIDVVKTKIQSEPEKYKHGMTQAALEIIKTEGPGALLAGLGPTVVGYGVEGAMKVRKCIGNNRVHYNDNSFCFGLVNLRRERRLVSMILTLLHIPLLCSFVSFRTTLLRQPFCMFGFDSLVSTKS